MRKILSLILSVCMVFSMLSTMGVTAGAEDVVYKKVPLDIEGFVVGQHKYTDEEIIYGTYVGDKLYVYGKSKEYNDGTCLIDVDTQEIAYDFPCEWTELRFYGTQFILVDETLYYAETFEEIGEFFINYQTSRILNEINEGFVKDLADGKWYYLSQDGTLSDAILSEDYVVHKYLGEGLFMYGKTRLWIGEYGDYDLYEAGIIDKEGNIICESSDEQLSFSISQGKIKIKEDGLWGYIDINGDEVIPCEYEEAGSFCDGLAAVKDNGLWGFIDEEGNEVISCEYEAVGDFADGLVKVQKNGLWGFIDEEGNEVVPCEYEAVEEFIDGLAKVQKNELWGFINETGEIVIPIEYYYIGNFNDDGVAYVYDSETERDYYINKKNEEVDYSYEDELYDDYVYSLSEEFLYGEEFDGYVIDNRTGNKVVIEGKNIRPYLMGDNNEYIFAEVDGKFYQILESDINDFEDISFVSTIFAYDGEEKTIEIEGELPEGATVTYTNNTATDAGTYRATAVIEAEGYNTLTLNANLVINKAELTVKADDVSMIKGGEMPELTYTVEGELFGDDLITGELATKANGSKTGKFDITKGTLTAGDNYVIDFEKGTLTVGDKLEQDVVVGEINEKTYGDEAFVIEVTKDEESGLDNFTFESSNANVAEVDEDGTVTIKAAGTTKITVTQSGNETYAAFEKTLTLTVNKAALTVKADDVSMIKGGEMPELTYTVEGELFGDDAITGALATKANGSKTGKFDITKGTLTAGDNYVIDFEKGTLTVFDKTPQDVVVGEISEKTYGDEAFVIEVTKDEESGLDNFTFESSNPSVAEVGEDGTVTIKAAGTTKITVTQPGNETYAAFEKTLTLTVNKAALTVKADDVFMIKGGEMPELTYTVEGELFGDDVITGELATKANGSKTGKFDITQGTIKANSNYKLTFEKGTLTVSDKKMQNVVVGEIGEKTYGDEAFVIEVTKDEESGLDNFTFESSNTAVAEVSEDGTVVIKTAGETTITVTQPGNETYAAFEKTLTLRVKKRTVRVESVDLNNKTAVLSGLAEGDEVEVDLENIELEADATENDVIEAVVKNFALLGTDAENYVLETESVTSEVSKENVVWVNVSAEMGTIEGEGIYLKGNKATVTAKPLSKYTFTGWYVGEELVSKNITYTFDATEDVSLVAQFKKKSSGGGGGSSVSYYTVKFDTNGGNDIDKQSVVKNNKATMPAEPKKEGYIFKGWFADEKLTVVYDFETKVTKNVTLYAAWEEIDNSANEIVLTIDDRTAVVFGEKVNNDVAPIIRNDRTMLPARFVAEKLGATVEWNNDERKVIVTKGEVEIIIIIDSDIAYVNGKAVTLDSKAFIENDRTYTPVRFVAESLGAKVEWNNTNRKVTITK